MSRRLKIIFTTSILLNVLLIGVVAGAGYKRMHGPMGRPGFDEPRKPEFNSKMATAMMAARKGQEPLQRELRAAKKELNDILAAQQFNEAAFIEASEKMYQAQEKLSKARNEITLKMAKEMTPEERQEVARRLQAMSERHERLKERFRERNGKKVLEGNRGDEVPPPSEN